MPFNDLLIRQAKKHLQTQDPVMKSLLKAHGPFTAKAQSDRFGTLVNSIISQQISTAAAASIKHRLHQAIAAQLGLNKLTRVSPQSILTFDLDQLRTLGISRQKGSYLLDLAEKVHSGEVELKRMSRMADEAVIEQLIQVKGIGRWTAQMFLIFSLARMDILPVDDLGIKNAIQRQYGLDSQPNAKQIEVIAQPWRPFATIASWYLWRSLQNDPK
jgi:DNA-3-methyladenine glycosylase II